MNDITSMFFRLWLNGIEIVGERKCCINSFDIDDLCDGSSTLTIQITDPDFVYIEDNIYVEEASVILEHGFNDDPEYDRFSGYVSAIDINFPESGAPTISLTCFDQSHVMNRSKKERSWERVTRADVVRKIATEYGYGVYIQPNYEFATIDTISQSNQTDIEFLESLANDEREPFLCKLIGDVLHYEKKGLLSTPTTTVGYRVSPFDVMSFNPQINKETRQENITSSDIKASDKSLESFTATDGNVSRDVQGESVKTPTTNYTYDPVTRKWNKETR